MLAAALQNDPLYHIDRFISEVEAATSLDQILDAFHFQVRRLGFDSFAYWLIWPPSGPRVPLYLTNFSKKWVQYYAEENFASDDVVGRYAALSARPFAWSEVKSRYILTTTQKGILSAATEVGLTAGGSVPIHGPGAAKATFSVCNDMPQAEFDRLFLSVRHEVHLMATYSHEKIMSLGLDTPLLSTISLTARETEILTWMARGKTAWEVGEILSISAETVKKHVESCCLRLNASNKTHAVAKALINGLIVP